MKNRGYDYRIADSMILYYLENALMVVRLIAEILLKIETIYLLRREYYEEA